MMNVLPIHNADSRTPEIVGDSVLEVGSLEEAYKAFEENFAALQEAREIQVVGLSDGSDAPVAQLEVVKGLETRDRQLRATIERMQSGEN